MLRPVSGVCLGPRVKLHELSIMDGALRLALQTAENAGARRIHAIALRIGALSGVVPDALQFAFETLKQGTTAEGARLVIENVPARFWCARCQREFVSQDMLADCPDCRTPSGELRGGREMELASVEID